MNKSDENKKQRFAIVKVKLLVLILLMFALPIHAESNKLNKEFVRDADIVMMVNQDEAGSNIILQSTNSNIFVIISNPKTGENTTYKLWNAGTYEVGSMGNLDINGKEYPDKLIGFDIYPESKRSLCVSLLVGEYNLTIHSDGIAFVKDFKDLYSENAKYSTDAKKSISFLAEWLKSHGFKKDKL